MPIAARANAALPPGQRWALLTLIVGFVVATMPSALPADRSLEKTSAKAKHVVLVVWDGMRPDFVTEANAPNLVKLAGRGVTFRRHHSIYPSLTNVNAAALATGLNPNRSGIIANWTFQPDLGGAKLTRTDAPEIIAKGDQLSAGKYIGGPTIAELVRAADRRTAVAGTKTAAFLHDRNLGAAKSADTRSVMLYGGDVIPAGKAQELVALLGPFPESASSPNVVQDAWTTRALTDVLWKDGVPEFTVLWLSDPDRSQHSKSPGTEVALAGIKSSDENLGRVIHALEEKKVLDQTDILLASDHGFSTIERAVDVPGFLRARGFEIAGEDDVVLRRGQVKVAGNGGTNLYYVGERDATTIGRLVETLQQTDFASVIFSRQPLEGTFPLSDARIDTASGPDVVMAFRWTSNRNADGVAGMIAANGSSGKDKGTHGTLSPFDLHNTFIAAGPDFRRGIESDLPTANTDVAATLFHLLGIEPPAPLDGRVVSEAMGNGDASLAAQSSTVDVTRGFAAGKWRQYLRLSRVGDSVYIDEGGGEFTPTAKP
jgi:predicted AlkP superfamily pyrophosphatase or phosphodiesterase